MAKTATRSVELEPIDRLEEKVKLLVGLVERMKAEQARAAEENQRLSRELEALRARLASSEGARRRALGAEGRARRHPHARHRHARAARSAQPVSACHVGRRASSRSRSTGSATRSAARSIRSTWRGWRSYVDEKMRAAADSTPTGDSLRLAVLAALNIADELFRCRDGTRAAQRRAGRARRRARAPARPRALHERSQNRARTCRTLNREP